MRFSKELIPIYGMYVQDRETAKSNSKVLIKYSKGSFYERSKIISISAIAEVYHGIAFVGTLLLVKEGIEKIL